MKIQMVDLNGQHKRLQPAIESAMRRVFERESFINGTSVDLFCNHLAAYLGTSHVIPCANGTDAIRLALQALRLRPGDEVILPAFTYIAAVEMVASLGLTPILVDVDADTFNIDPNLIEQAISRHTKAIIPVHLFGQVCDMDPIMKLAAKYGIGVVEDNAQSVSADYRYPDGTVCKAGTIGHLATTSFFPTKPLACCGDGGAVIAADGELAERVRMLANHGQTEKYFHQIVGCNSRLDTLQAAILDVKLRHLDAFTAERQRVAARYDRLLSRLDAIQIPVKAPYSTHVYHQYTLRVEPSDRDALRERLRRDGIPTMVYYPLPIYEQQAYRWIARPSGPMDVSGRLCAEVLSLPIHTEMTDEMQDAIIGSIYEFYGEKL